MKRNLDVSLLEWKERAHRKPLLLRGARQTGKTFAVRTLGKTFPVFVELNFEREPKLNELFEADLDPVRIARDIELYSGRPLKSGNSLLFFDEVQFCPKALAALRYFYEEMPSLHVIGAGSLLEFEWERLSVPVGRIQYRYVRPFTFTEFLLNLPSTALIAEQLTEFSYKKPIPAPVHEKLLGELRNFYHIGGMPRAIGSFLETNSFLDVREEQRSIVQTYRTDFNKYCGRAGIEEIEKVFAALPRLVGKKTVYNHIDPDARPEQVRRAIHLMEKALVVHRILSTPGDGLPLEAGASEKHYKTALLDIGLMNALLAGRTQWSMSTTTSDHFTGAASEQFVAQECKNIYGPTENRGLNYWFRNKKGSTAEVDFLIEIGGEIIPLEVKAGSTGRLKSMNLFLSSHPNSPFGIRLCGSNFVRNDRIFTIPLYAACLLGPLCSRLLQDAG